MLEHGRKPEEHEEGEGRREGEIESEVRGEGFELITELAAV